MTLDLHDCVLAGSAFTAAFLRDGLASVVPPVTSNVAGWNAIRAALCKTGPHRGQPSVTTALAQALGYTRLIRQDTVITREGAEHGGWLLHAENGPGLRTWSVPAGCELDGFGRGDRASPGRAAQRVLLAKGERAGLITNGEALRLLICDPARADSSLTVPLESWRGATLPPDSWRLLHALAGAVGLADLPSVLEAARLHQTKVTKTLRRQAREAITGFINAALTRVAEPAALDAAALWREGLVLVYRLLFILKLESPAEPDTGFSFAATGLWRGALSPNRALARLVRRHLDHGHDTGRMLEDGLRLLFRVFRDGLSCSELRITPLGGALFATGTTPLLDSLDWGERAVAILLDRLIWTAATGGERARVHYGSLGVEDLGSVYEALLEQEPGIATQPLIRVPRGKQETVMPAAGTAADIAPGAFYLRAGPGRKATGSYYTPHEFVGFLVRETLDPAIAALSPADDPNPAALLTLSIVDPATGSGHFLVEACRHLGEALLNACIACDRRGLQDRMAAAELSDAGLASYLPSRGFAEARARAICRRLVAVHCLYGSDRNHLAIELAKLSLWLESWSEGLPLTFLDHRLVHGDALTGSFFDGMKALPVTGGPLDPLLARGVAERLDAALDTARRLVADLNASIGRDAADIALKQVAKARLDAVLSPLRKLARARAGAVMLHERDSDDCWLVLASHVAHTGTWPDSVSARQQALLEAGADALPWDLQFPEIFPGGFSVVLGNPPWDVVQHNTKDFVSDYDPAVLTAATKADRSRIERTVLSQPDAASAFDAYRTGFERMKRVARALYAHQRVRAGSDSTAGNLDLFRLFAERAIALSAADGAIGMLVPSAFHANEGSTGIRQLYVRRTALDWCLSFENRRRFFDIDSRFKFDLIVCRRPGPTRAFRCGFYLESIADAADTGKIMTYDMDFLRQSGGDSLTPLELRGSADWHIARRLFAHPDRLGAWCEKRRIRLGRDLHMTDDSGLFRRPGAGDLIVQEGKTFHQYIDSFDTAPRYSVQAAEIRPAIAEAAQHYRLVFRDIAQATNERTMIACIAAPGSVFGHTATVEKTPGARRMQDALVLCAVFNSFTFDWLVRQKAATHLSLYILDGLPLPRLDVAAERFLATAALRLTCTGTQYDRLWQEQRGGFDEIMRIEARTELRAAIDAVVADAYGLDLQGYRHVLSSFSHRSDPAASRCCIARFQMLRRIGCAAFYARIPSGIGEDTGTKPRPQQAARCAAKARR